MSTEVAIREFLAGWTYSRSFPGTAYQHYKPLFHVHFGDRRYGRFDELLLLEPAEPAHVIRCAACLITGPHWLTIFASGQDQAALEAAYTRAGYKLRYQETLMEKALAAEQPPVLPARLSLQTLSHVSDQAWQERFFAALPSYAQMALEAPRLTHYRVLIEGKSVASARSSITPHSSLCVDEVYTDPAFRRRGLASILIQQLLYDASLSGIHTSVLLASEMGKPLYLKLGYRALATALIFEKKE